MFQLLQSKRLWITGIPAVIAVIIGAMIFISSQYKEIYKVEFNGENLGYVSSPNVITEWVKSKKEKFQAQFPDIDYRTNEKQIYILPMTKYNPAANNQTVLAALSENFKLEAIGTEVIIDGQVIGVVKNKKIAETILNQIQTKFVPRKDISKVTTLSYNPGRTSNESASGSVKSVQFVEKVETKTVNADPKQFLSANELMDKLMGNDIKKIKYTVQSGDCVSCIAQRFNVPQQVIYDNNPWIEDDFIKIGDELDLTVRRPLLSVRTEELVTETVEIPSGVEVAYDNSMRIGSSKVVIAGKPGRKKLTYLVTKVNGELIDEKIQQVEVLEKPIPKKVIQGSKIIKGIGTGSFAWPITDPTITSKFGQRWGRLHAGTDTVSDNREIYASDNGKVVYAGYNSGYGNHVIIDHQNGYKTLYAHMSKLKVKKGALVEKGDLIGIMGSTGQSTGVHLHFEILKDGDQVNPLTYLD